MKGMTKQERLNDVCRISGLPEDIVRRVINGEIESTECSLRRGERVSLYGRCILEPTLRKRLQVGGKMAQQIAVNATVATSLLNELQSLSEFESSEYEEEPDNGIRLNQISSLG